MLWHAVSLILHAVACNIIDIAHRSVLILHAIVSSIIDIARFGPQYRLVCSAVLGFTAASTTKTTCRNE